MMRAPVPLSGGLILSYRCTAECLHCMYACTPAWEGGWITLEDMESILTNLAPHIQPSPYGSENISLNYGLHFTGGEPFLNFRLLCRAVEIANKLHIPSTFVETNCYWSVNDRVTREKLQILKSKGLRGLMISVNPFYLEYIPFERTQRAIQIGYDIFGENLAIYQLEYYRRFKKAKITGRVLFENYLFLEKKEEFLKNVEFFILGRAAYKLGGKLKHILPRYPGPTFFNEACIPSFMRNWHNHFDNYGNYVPGYCGGITYGDIRHVDDLFTKEISEDEYPVLFCLMREDMRGVFHIAEEYGYKMDCEGYFSRCHFCTDMRKFLVQKAEFKELKPREFYSHLE